MTETHPIRVLHLADIHLGVESYGTIDPQTGLSRRLQDFLRGLDVAVEEALAGDVDLVLFAGDYFRVRDPNPTHLREFARRVRRLADAGLPVFMLAGNHDLPPAQGRASSIDIFDALTVPGVRVVARKPELVTMETRRGPVQIYGLPWIYRGAFLTRDALRGKTLAEIDSEVVATVERFLRAAAEQMDARPGVPRILAAHASVQGAVFGSERQIALGQDVVLPRAVALDPAFDYVALGHIHKHQVLSTEPLAVYPGSIDRVDFGEEREDKGYVVAEVWRGGARHRFRQVPARRFVSIVVTAEGDNPTERVLQAVEAANVADAVVRLQVNTPPELDGQVDMGRIRQALRGASYVASLTKKVDRRFRARIGDRFVEQMTPLQALEAYLQSKDESPERIKRLLELADPLIREG